MYTTCQAQKGCDFGHLLPRLQILATGLICRKRLMDLMFVWAVAFIITIILAIYIFGLRDKVCVCVCVYVCACVCVRACVCLFWLNFTIGRPKDTVTPTTTQIWVVMNSMRSQIVANVPVSTESLSMKAYVSISFGCFCRV